MDKAWMIVGGLVLVLALPAGGCFLGDADSPPTEEEVVEDSEQGRGTPASDIVVRIINGTALPLDPQLFVAPVAAGRDAVFEEANARTDYGLGGVGVLLAGTQDTLSLGCDDMIFIATAGGVVGDDLVDPDAVGRPVILEEGVNVNCGDEVVFVFEQFGTRLLVSYDVGPREAE